MSFKIECLKLKNFKCFDDKKFYEFRFNYNANPTILSGPNGFGKTTFFDAIELIFTNKITRLKIEIEDQRTNLGSNILLNNAEKLGYLVLTLVNEAYNKITIVAKISNITKLTISSSLTFTYVEGDLDTDQFDLFLKTVDLWHENLDSFECVKYIKEHFNVYYYVSQAESVHFLKNSINNRKDSMNGLLQLEDVEQHKEKIGKQLIGGSKIKSGVIINDEISKIRTELNSKLKLLKSKNESNTENLEKVEYAKLLKYPDNQEIKTWDLEDINFSNKTQKDIENFYNEIDSLVCINKNIQDYKKYLSNCKIESLINNSEAIKNFIKYFNKINADEIDIIAIQREIDYNKKLIEIFKNSDFFTKEFDVKHYQKKQLEKLKELFEQQLLFNIDEIDGLICHINELTKTINANQKTINEIITARLKLHELDASNKDNVNCPYCGFEYSNNSLLEAAYSALTEKLNGSQSENLALITQCKNKIIELLSKDTKVIKNTLEGIDSDAVRRIQLEITNNEKFLKTEQLKKDVLDISKYILQEKSWINFSYENQIAEIRTILNTKTEKYTSNEFTFDLKKHNFELLFNNNEYLFEIEQVHLWNDTFVANKKKFIGYKFSCLQNSEISALKEEIFTLLQKHNKMEFARNNFDILRDSYQNSIENYKNKILDKLRVPLLIYTGKILQDYQNGLGVFINKDEMRFVSNGDAKHDILNTFSSGQLSAFVLSFLFAMNKRYIFKETDDISFILIDDPVQTMDDINISSFIEVLRNDFKDKQIILSTHETDKENYILYKFLKYNLIGQSFNVKDRMYQ